MINLLLIKPLVFRINYSTKSYDSFLVFQWSLLKTELPPQVNILTIEPIAQEKNVLTVLFRVEHFYEPNEHSTLSKSVTLNVNVSISYEKGSLRAGIYTFPY